MLWHYHVVQSYNLQNTVQFKIELVIHKGFVCV